MGRWMCPVCEREFALAHQAHVCVPACTVEETFAGRPPVQRAVYEAIVSYLRSLGPLHLDTVRVGVFLKHERKLAEVRPQARSLALSLFLPRRVEHPRISRHIPITADRVVHVVRLRSIEDVDETVRDWLAEAYLASGP